MDLERLLDVARPDEYLRLTRMIALVRQAEALKAKRQTLDRFIAKGETGFPRARMKP
jgi:hypothetical protein